MPFFITYYYFITKIRQKATVEPQLERCTACWEERVWLGQRPLPGISRHHSPVIFTQRQRLSHSGHFPSSLTCYFHTTTAKSFGAFPVIAHLLFSHNGKG